MRSRLSILLNDLSLEEILLLEEELDRRKEKHRRHYAVLSVQTDKNVLRAETLADLPQLTRDMRRFLSACTATGGGTVLGFTPEVSVLLFNSVASASRTCSALLAGLPEFNGRFHQTALRVSLKLGLASGVDTLAAGSPRSVRVSTLVRRANHAAWRGTANALLMDENSYHEWPEKYAVTLVPFDIDGQHIYRTVPDIPRKTLLTYDDESLLRFLRKVADAGIPTLKYDLERLDEVDPALAGAGQSGEMMQLLLEAYDPNESRNLSFKEKIAAADYGDRVEIVKRMLNSVGLALVRHELSAESGV